LAGKVTAGLAESNGNLPPGGWLEVTCGLTTCTPGSAPGLTLGNEYGRIFTFTLTVPSDTAGTRDISHHDRSYSQLRVVFEGFVRFGLDADRR